MKKLCLLLAVLVSSGCAHTAPEQVKQEAPAVKKERPELSAALVEKTIVKGKTTKNEILAKLGGPNSVAGNTNRPANQAPSKEAAPLERATETWNYWTVPPTEALGRSGQVKIFRLTVYFDDKGVALDYRAGESTLNIP